MSEQGWRDFLAALGGSDWVVLHGGATAVFRVKSLVEAARLAEALAQVPESRRRRADDDRRRPAHRPIDPRRPSTGGTARRRLTRYRRWRGITARSPTGRGSRRCSSPSRPARCDRCRLLARRSRVRALADDNAIDPLGHGPKVWMQALDPAKPLRHAMHVDVSVAREQAEHRLAAALAAGGRIVDESNAPAVWILADRAGNRVCIASWPDGAAQ